jgi:predicted nucleic acid-binding protein
VARRPDASGKLAARPHGRGRLGLFLASQSHLQEIHFLWRPFLPDPDDDMVLELAVAAGCRHIITHNVKDFHGSEQLGVTALSPREFLNLIRKRP